MAIPGPACEKYELSKALPEFAIIPKTDLIVKNSNYYNSREFLWNRKAAANPKIYSFYHQINDEKIDTLKKIAEQEDNDRWARERARSAAVQVNKDEVHRRMEERKMERLALQAESSQKIIEEPGKMNTLGNGMNDLSIINPLVESLISDRATTQKIVQKRTLISQQSNRSAKTLNSWNNLGSMSDKNLQIMLRPNVVDSEDRAIKTISQRIEKDEKVATLRQNCFAKKHDEIHRKFVERHNQNMVAESKIGLAPQLIRNSSIDPTKFSYMNDFPEDLDKANGATPTMEHGTYFTKYGNFKMIPQTNQIIENLSRPKSQYMSKKPYAHSEFRGLILADLPASQVNLNTKVVQTLVHQAPSIVTTLDVLQRARPQTQNMSSRIGLASRNKARDHSAMVKAKSAAVADAEEAETAMNDIDEFMRIHKAKNVRRVGYPRIALIEAQTYSNAEALRTFKKIQEDIAAHAGKMNVEVGRGDGSDGF